MKITSHMWVIFTLQSMDYRYITINLKTDHMEMEQNVAVMLCNHKLKTADDSIS